MDNLDFGLSEFVISHAHAMDRDPRLHYDRQEYLIDTTNQNPSSWSKRWVDRMDLHPGLEVELFKEKIKKV